MYLFAMFSIYSGKNYMSKHPSFAWILNPMTTMYYYPSKGKLNILKLRVKKNVSPPEREKAFDYIIWC